MLCIDASSSTMRAIGKSATFRPVPKGITPKRRDSHESSAHWEKGDNASHPYCPTCFTGRSAAPSGRPGACCLIENSCRPLSENRVAFWSHRRFQRLVRDRGGDTGRSVKQARKGLSGKGQV